MPNTRIPDPDVYTHNLRTRQQSLPVDKSDIKYDPLDPTGIYRSYYAPERRAHNRRMHQQSMPDDDESGTDYRSYHAPEGHYPGPPARSPRLTKYRQYDDDFAWTMYSTSRQPCYKKAGTCEDGTNFRSFTPPQMYVEDDTLSRYHPQVPRTLTPREVMSLHTMASRSPGIVILKHPGDNFPGPPQKVTQY